MDDEALGQLLAVKSAGGLGMAAERLRHEGHVLSALRSPHIVLCLGSRAAGAGDEYQLVLEFAPRGSLADEAARSSVGRLAERDIRAYTGDVARVLAYLMAPEAARGEEQGPPADMWALACTVIEMATGAAPWSDADDVYMAVHRIAYTDAVPETPAWLSSEAKDFLRWCLQRNPQQRPSVAQVLDHPFLVSAEPAKHGWTWATASPKSTLNVDLWDSDDDDDDDEASESVTGRISSLASLRSALPVAWDSEDGWIDAHSEECYQPQVSEVAWCRFWPQE
ncbi:mitogen-activated protein kinase kinase kinase 17-like [Miscanthus floridulus]|uniref:mitogen-activated protein kinase kinase kinase 17-like n=1 Tax=Miscanthus floridulus TaxID=154761 RepID=UPI00345AABFF